MSPEKQNGCGCSRIPISLVLVILGGSYWWFIHQGNLKLDRFFPAKTQAKTPTSLPTATVTPVIAQIPTKTVTPTSTSTPAPVVVTPKPPTPWEQKTIRGIYLSRYQVTNNADEQTIRQRIRYYRDRGINTIIHGVWGNGCTMYQSAVTQELLGQKSCPNEFQSQWLDWAIDEAHRNGMQFHAYFEKGIKLDRNSPIFEMANQQKWLVPGIDKTYAGVDHYLLDTSIPAVTNLFDRVLVEFVKKYPKVDAVQWDDYLGYHAELPGGIDRTADLTKFMQQTIANVKQANPQVSFDVCHHNPYWAKRYFAADWSQWKVDRAFIQAYNEKNFKEELNYARNYAGIAITDRQFARIPELIKDPKIKSVLIFPFASKPEETADRLGQAIGNK
jgi:uncharacterized lipoprotein YddW (UPF0748 family)